MTVTKTTKTAKDAASTPTPFQIGLADESGVGAGPFPGYMYLAEPAGGALVTPAQDGADATGVSQLSGGVGIRGWLSGIYSKLSAALAVTQSGTWTVQPGNAANTTPWLMNNTASATGGAASYSATGGTGNALLTNTAIAVKTSAGSLFGVNFVNTGASAAYVQVFDAAAGSVTLGATVPKLSFWVPAGGAWEEKFSAFGVAFATAITVAATATATGSTAPAIGIIANITFK